MTEEKLIEVAIVDHGLGNLFSVKHACAYAGMQANITTSKQEILAADAVIVPGVGAFGDAMQTLKRLDLISLLRDIASSQKCLVGICLGMQLLMTESYEFGLHQGLGIIEGSVTQFDNPTGPNGKLKVPQIGWNHILKADRFSDEHPEQILTDKSSWADPLLTRVHHKEFMYFVHSFYIKPADSSITLSTTCYGDVEFCSSLRYGNVFACQFHPERSGPAGLMIYQNLASYLKNTT